MILRATRTLLKMFTTSRCYKADLSAKLIRELRPRTVKLTNKTVERMVKIALIYFLDV